MSKPPALEDSTRGAPRRETVIVVPCRNEAHRLRPDEFLAYADRDPRTGFLFVDDESNDSTREVLDGLVTARPGAFSTISLAAHGGKAEAVRRGVLVARQVDPVYIGYWDADLSIPLAAIGEMRAQLEREPSLEIVLGSRVRLLGRRIHRSPVRHYLGRVFATVASLVLDLPVYDTQCGAKLFRAGAYLDTLFSEPFRSRWIFDVELLARFLSQPPSREGPPTGERLFELPLHAWEDVGASRLRARDFIRAPLELLEIYLRYRRLRDRGGRRSGSGDSR